MSDVLYQKVLQSVPSSWSNQAYGNELYKLIDVPDYTDEYNEIKNEFEKISGSNKYYVTKIERIQHPTAYGRFLLRKEQLELRGNTANIVRAVEAVRKNQLKEAIQYNIDSRQVQTSYLADSDQVVIVTKKFQYCHQNRDCNSYPEYVIHFDLRT